MNKLIASASAVLVAVALSACAAPSTGALPQSAPAQDSAASSSAPAPAATASTCDKAREALLTGSPAAIKTAMKALKADKSANATAREYADYYMNRDAADKQLQDMDKSLIQSSCTL